MKIKIVSPIKIENKFTLNALEEYGKRLGPYCKIEFKKSNSLVNEISNNAYIIKIDKKGEQLSSENFADKINKLGISGKSNVVILLEDVDNVNIDYKLSISNMDFPIDLLMIILYEQIYRAYRIINNIPYHK